MNRGPWSYNQRPTALNGITHSWTISDWGLIVKPHKSGPYRFLGKKRRKLISLDQSCYDYTKPFFVISRKKKRGRAPKTTQRLLHAWCFGSWSRITYDGNATFNLMPSRTPERPLRTLSSSSERPNSWTSFEISHSDARQEPLRHPKVKQKINGLRRIDAPLRKSARWKAYSSVGFVAPRFYGRNDVPVVLLLWHLVEGSVGSLPEYDDNWHSRVRVCHNCRRWSHSRNFLSSIEW